ncbi:hypothetical protein JCM11251_004403 [Rhodosporidiobolus azoricus]
MADARPPLDLSRPILPHLYERCSTTSSRTKIFLWTAELEAVYQMVSGWEVLVEAWFQHWCEWHYKGTGREKLDAEERGAFLFDQFIHLFALYRRAFVPFYISPSLAPTLGALEALQLPGLPRMDEVPLFLLRNTSVELVTLAKRIDPSTEMPLPPGWDFSAVAAVLKPTLIPEGLGFPETEQPEGLLRFFQHRMGEQRDKLQGFEALPHSTSIRKRRAPTGPGRDTPQP